VKRLQDGPIDRGGDFERGLIGLDLRNYVAGRHGVTLVPDPSGDQTLLDRVAKLWDFNDDGHLLSEN
jgi:hypothetical protein